MLTNDIVNFEQPVPEIRNQSNIHCGLALRKWYQRWDLASGELSVLASHAGIEIRTQYALRCNKCY